MAGTSVWPGALDTLLEPVPGAAFSTTPLSTVIVGAMAEAIMKMQAWLDAAPVNVVSTSSGAFTLPDPRQFPFTLATIGANTALTMPSTATPGKSFIAEYVSGGVGGWTLTHTGVRWNGGTAYVMSTAAGSVDIVGYMLIGGNWNGFVLGKGMA